MSFLRRNGGTTNGERPRVAPIALLESADDGWREHTARPVESGVWLVVKLSKDVPEGGWKPKYGSPEILAKHLAEADTGVEAIKALYQREYARVPDDNPEAANGRYVAIDFYGGERVEALVTGDWHVDLRLAPQTLGPPT